MKAIIVLLLTLSACCTARPQYTPGYIRTRLPDGGVKYQYLVPWKSYRAPQTGGEDGEA